jgi:voltage-gated potassium channel Kch
MANTMLRFLEVAFGLLIWLSVLWDGFATVILPRTVDPTRRPSGRFAKCSWWMWARVGRSIRSEETRLSFLAVYGPISVMVLLILWAILMIFAFALIYAGLGPRFYVASGSVDFATLLYMSGSTFLTLGLGDVTSPDPLARLFMILEAASGFIFLGLIITYMPVLDQAYSAREVGNSLICSRAGRPPGAIQLLRRYSGSDRSEVLRGNLREGERWMAEILQSHLSHPVLSFYRAQHLGESWLVSVTTILDSCSLLIVGGDGMPAAQARLTYRMGIRLLQDLTRALGAEVDPGRPARLTEADSPALFAALEASGLSFLIAPGATEELVRLIRRYEVYLVALSDFLLIPLPSWIPPLESTSRRLGTEEPEVWDN